MTTIDYDTEFIETGPDKPVRLISIGMVRADGRELYRILDDPKVIGAAIRHPWLRDNVVPSLPLTLSDYGWSWDTDHPDHQHVKPRAEIAADVQAFVLGVPDPELWAWYAAYDHVVMCQLFGAMVDLPEGFPQFSHDLKQEVDRLGNPGLPSMPGITEHNAIDDAREVRYRRRWLKAYAFSNAAAR